MKGRIVCESTDFVYIPWKFDPNSLTVYDHIWQRKVDVQPKKTVPTIYTFINCGSPNTAHESYHEKHCKLGIRKVDVVHKAVVITTRAIKKWVFLLLYHGHEYWTIVQYLYIDMFSTCILTWILQWIVLRVYLIWNVSYILMRKII